MSEFTHIVLGTAVSKPFPLYFTLVYVVGFIAAVSIGLIAFFNSKRPMGWEDAKRPDLIPDLSKKDSESKDATNSEQ